MNEELKPCPFCGNLTPFTYISFACAVLECTCGVKMKGGAVKVMYKKEDLPEALKPHTYEATGLVLLKKDGEQVKWPDHGYIGVNVIEAFRHAGLLEMWNRRAAPTEDRKDAERYRWLKSQGRKQTAYDRYGDGCHWAIGFYSDDSRKDFDAAIDAAMGATPTPAGATQKGEQG